MKTNGVYASQCDGGHFQLVTENIWNVALKERKQRKNCFTSLWLFQRFPLVFQMDIYTILLSGRVWIFFWFRSPFRFSIFSVLSSWFACCPIFVQVGSCKRRIERVLRPPSPMTFATLWPLPSLPAFGPGLDLITTWYRLILRKEDKFSDLLLTAVTSEVALLVSCGYSGPS